MVRVETYVDRARGGKIDFLVADLAERQHGVVARQQLLALGLSEGAIEHRLACGRLHPVHRGVYAVGHRVLSQEGRWMAAVLASGAGAVLSHRAAAARWDLRQSARPRVEVTVPQYRRPRRGIESRVACLPADEVTVVRAIQVTTPSRTLLDLATVLPPHALRQAVHEAEVLRLGDALSLADLIARHPRRRGVRALRRIVDEGNLGSTVARSELELRFLAFLADAGLPRPDVNSRIEGMEVDFAWRPAQLVVELDGFAAHGTRAAFERDRERDRRLQAAGWRVVRVTWRHLNEHPRRLGRELEALLNASRPTLTAP